MNRALESIFVSIFIYIHAHQQLAIPERRHSTCCIPHGQGIRLHGARSPHVSAAGVSEDPVLSTDRSGAWLSVSGVMAAMGSVFVQLGGT